ncbi:MAG: AAA family ATPase [Lachnospiraceae bacterium]|nr:AAA family ATPase [Lachnospiraceae bacterium]
MERKKTMSQMNRKTATKLLMVNWSRFQNETVSLEGSMLFTGVNGSGKSTILDAMTYLLTGNTQFNKAAKDRDRTVLGYVRGDTKSNGADRYLRKDAVVSYIAMEFWSPVENMSLVAAVCMESNSEADVSSYWFVCRDICLQDINFSMTEGKNLYVTPRLRLALRGEPMKSSDFMGRDKGTEQILRALGLRCDVKKYRAKLVKMMAFNPENNIDQFIQECVLEPGKVDSLKELREQKEHFEKLRESYQELQNGKEKLEEIEQKTQDYEKMVRMLGIRELMLIYQELKGKEREKDQAEIGQQTLKLRLRSLEQQKMDIAEQLEYARTRLQAAESNSLFTEMQSTIASMKNRQQKLESQVEKYENETAKLKKLQTKLSEELLWLLEEGIDSDVDRAYLMNLAETGYAEEKKCALFQRLCTFAERKKKLLQNERVHLEDEEGRFSEEQEELSGQLAQLESNRLIEPVRITEAKKFISKELEKQGIHTEVRTFAELVQDIRNENWRMAIETFLGNKRHHIIVDGKYCHQALEILHENQIQTVTIVLTDKLPDTSVTMGSAAEQLEIPSVYGRRYANYLLNGIHLCRDLRELHDHPKGGLMRDGTLAKSYAVSLMNMKETRACLGSRAVELQKTAVIQRQKELNELLLAIGMKLEFVQRKSDQIEEIQWKTDQYLLSAPEQLDKRLQEIRRIELEIEQVEKNPDFTKVLEEQQKAKKYYKEVWERADTNSADIGACKEQIVNNDELLKGLAAEIYRQQQLYEEECLKHLEWKRPMLEEYEKMRKRQDDIRVIKKSTVDRQRERTDESRRSMENAQLEYCRIAGIDLLQRGPAYIPFYREQYRNIANVKIEQVRAQLDEQSKRLESAFMNDFVAEINETVMDAKLEIEAINRELKLLPFGNDTYRFVMKEKADRAAFFRICRRLKDYMDSPEVYMSSMREDEEMEHDIQEFMGVILEEEDETEYTDYRKYFSYDMEIISNQGSVQVTADLSKKQGSASNGEKQTPYFIILAASLMQYYPRQTCCARLAFIDEAFSALSRERIEQMVKYLEANAFQVFYAAPPEKISSIGQFIDSTASLVITGRYTRIVEGLIRQNEI